MRDDPLADDCEVLPAASVSPGHTSDQLADERGHTHGRSVRREGRVLVRRVSHLHRLAVIRGFAQGRRLPAAASLRSHLFSMHAELNPRSLGVGTTQSTRVRFSLSRAYAGEGSSTRLIAGSLRRGRREASLLTLKNAHDPY